jgi:hypothetical protein
MESGSCCFAEGSEQREDSAAALHMKYRDGFMAVQIFQQGARFAHPLPDLLLAMILALAALTHLMTPEQLLHVPQGFLGIQEELLFVLFVEGGFLLMQGTLVDIATRLKKQPPIWLAVIILGGVVLFSGYPLQVLMMAWHMGWFVFLPLLGSLIERGATLWRMPNRTRLEKIAARALIANRITTGLGVAAVLTIGTLTGLFESWAPGMWAPLAGGSLYFAIAALDDWRVRGPAFAERQRVLFGYDPIGIDYLAPV